MADLKVSGWGLFPVPGEKARLRRLESSVDQLLAPASRGAADPADGPVGGQSTPVKGSPGTGPLVPRDDGDGDGDGESGPADRNSEQLGQRKIFFEGQEGADVTQLQERLVSFGFLQQALISGKFDQETKNALTTFQHKFGIYVDGVAGSVTAKVLRFLGAINYQPDDVPVSDDVLALIQRVARSQSLGIALIGRSFDIRRSDSGQVDPRVKIVNSVSRELVDLLNNHPILQGAEFPEGYTPNRSFLLANSIDAELVVYLDVQDSPDIKPGIATFFFRTGSSDSAVGAPLAECIHDELMRIPDMRDRGCTGENSLLLQRPKGPAVRVVLGNLGHPLDRVRLEDQEYAESLAKAIMMGILRLYDLDLPEPAVTTSG
jgi:peptidoglycan hydrolase-like protein with peptidoglycan-binding domain